jgi:hypothetical protein
MKDQDKTLAILTHLLGIFTGFIGALIILIVSKNKKVKEHAKLALNWQISYVIYSIIGGILIFFLIGFLILLALAIINLVFCIIATIRASEGKLWKYPMSISFFKFK